MIKTLGLYAFQSHISTELELSDGINLLVGQSDSGKTAIIRALKWLATNRPLGKDFQSTNGGDVGVSIILDNGDCISHTVGKYAATIDRKDQDWSAIGTGVPETITNLLNMSDLSWQFQMDPPFLLSNSPGEVARILNEVTDLDKIDSSLTNINRMARENKAGMVEQSNRKKQIEMDLTAYE
jgi:exonuclease SbcC